MADWFETRFRDPVDAGRIDPAFAARMRALVVKEWQADRDSTPSDDSGADHPEGEIIMLETRDPRTSEEPPSPERRPRGRWLLIAAAVALVAVVGTLAATDDDEEVDTASATGASLPTAPAAQDVLAAGEFKALEPGPYFVDPDGDETTPLRVTFQVAAEGWESWSGAVKFTDVGHTALSIVTVDNVVRDGCRDQRPAAPAVGPTVADLATALSGLAPFEVTSAPSDVTLLGHQGTHLQLTVPDMPIRGVGDDREFTACRNLALHSWIAPNLGGSFYGYNGEPGRTEDFWILDVDGTRLVLVAMSSPESPPQDVAELEAIFDSIRIEP